MKVSLVSLGRYSRDAEGHQVDGIVGYEFFQHLKVTIHFKKKVVYAWNRPSLTEAYFVAKDQNKS